MVAAVVIIDWCAVCHDKVDDEGRREPGQGPSLCRRCRLECKRWHQRLPKYSPFRTDQGRAEAFVDMKLRERHQKWWRRLARKFRR